jgi:hypothetical protein
MPWGPAPWFPDTTGVLAALLRRGGEAEESESLANAFGSGNALGDAQAHMPFHLLNGEICRLQRPESQPSLAKIASMMNLGL